MVKLKANHCFMVVHVLFLFLPPPLSVVLPVFYYFVRLKLQTTTFFVLGKGLKIPSSQAVHSPCHTVLRVLMQSIGATAAEEVLRCMYFEFHI